MQYGKLQLQWVIIKLGSWLNDWAALPLLQRHKSLKWSFKRGYPDGGFGLFSY
jgi:hypothetical protein